jgi:hypothetical protein
MTLEAKAYGLNVLVAPFSQIQLQLKMILPQVLCLFLVL